MIVNIDAYIPLFFPNVIKVIYKLREKRKVEIENHL